MKDLFFKFPNQQTMVAELSKLGMNHTEEVQQTDELSRLVYTIEQKPAYNWDYHEDGTPNFQPKLDEFGNPIMEEVQIPVMETVERANLGGHQYAAWVVGEISGIDGYHLNVRLIDENFDLSSLQPYLVIPKNPICTWA